MDDAINKTFDKIFEPELLEEIDKKGKIARELHTSRE